MVSVNGCDSKFGVFVGTQPSGSMYVHVRKFVRDVCRTLVTIAGASWHGWIWKLMIAHSPHISQVRNHLLLHSSRFQSLIPAIFLSLSLSEFDCLACHSYQPQSPTVSVYVCEKYKPKVISFWESSHLIPSCVNEQYVPVLSSFFFFFATDGWILILTNSCLH